MPPPEAGSAATELLRLCAFLDPAHPVPVSLFDGAAGELPTTIAGALRARETREAVFDALLDQGAGGVAGGDLVLAPSAAQATREGLDLEARRDYARYAARAVAVAFPADPGKVEEHDAAARLFPHAAAAAAHAAELDVALTAAAQLFYLSGRYALEVRHDHAGARELLERAVTVRGRAHGVDDVRVAYDLNYLNGALLHFGEWGEMASNAQRAADVLEGEYGARDRTVITHVNNAALLLSRAGDRVGARAWFARALALAEPVFGRSHPFCATILSNIGDLNHVEGDTRGAREAYRRALAIDEGVYGPRHASVARDLVKLGEVLVETGEHDAARMYLSRALAWFTNGDGGDDLRASYVRRLLATLDE